MAGQGKDQKGVTWTARLEVPLTPDLSLEEDIFWPKNLSQTPSHSIYEDPDRGIFVCEVYLEQKPNEKEIRAMETALKGFLKTAKVTLEFKKSRTADWVKKSLAGLKPVETNRFFIHGSHDADKIPRGKISILIEASLAFGTGHHATTKGCIEALERLAGTKAKAILDLGTGSGILAIAASNLWSRAEIIASDYDPEAAAKARENVLANRAGGIKVVEADGFRDVLLKGKTFDVIIANILAGPLIELAPDMALHAKKGSRVILAGLLENQKETVLKAYQKAEFKLENEAGSFWWPVLVLTKT